jgi:hypothetical protein
MREVAAGGGFCFGSAGGSGWESLILASAESSLRPEGRRRAGSFLRGEGLPGQNKVAVQDAERNMAFRTGGGRLRSRGKWDDLRPARGENDDRSGGWLARGRLRRGERLIE